MLCIIVIINRVSVSNDNNCHIRFMDMDIFIVLLIRQNWMSNC